MNRREEILKNAELALMRFTYQLAHPDFKMPFPMALEESLCKCAEHMSMVIWNISNSEETYDELTDEEVEDGIL